MVILFLYSFVMILLLTRQMWRSTHFQESTLKSICASAPILFYGVNMMSITTDKNRAKKQFFPLPTLAEYMIYFFLYFIMHKICDFPGFHPYILFRIDGIQVVDLNGFFLNRRNIEGLKAVH